MPTLIIPVGLPGSGKSTYTASLNDAFVINPDSFRYNADGIYDAKRPGVWEKSYAALASWLRRSFAHGSSNSIAVFDATNLDKLTRSPLIHIPKGFGVTVEAVFFNTPYEECCARNNLRRADRRVPDKVMENMRKRLQLPTEAEGFDSVTVRS